METTSHLQSHRSIKHTSRGCHTIFSRWEIPHHAASSKLPQQKQSVYMFISLIFTIRNEFKVKLYCHLLLLTLKLLNCNNMKALKYF